MSVAALDYRPQQPWLPASENLLQWSDDFHELMLQDRLRMSAFETAVKEVVRPGMVVLDLGTGTGILVRWALEAGARHAYGIDFNADILKVAQTQLDEAGYGDRFTALHGLSFDVDLPERVDVVISETMGNIVDNEDCVRILLDARRRFLKPDGLLLPQRADSYLVPVDARPAHASVARGDIADTPDAARTLRDHGVDGPFDTYYDTILPRDTYLTAPRLLRRYTFGADEPSTYHESVVFPVQRDGTFTGFKGYFAAVLSETVTLDISGDDIPGGTTSASWKHCYLPIAGPLPVRRHDRIILSFSRSYPKPDAPSLTQRYRWEGAVMRGTQVLAQFGQGSTG